jgi:hypothetical protein
MSIKIYDGFIISPYMSLEKIFPHLMEFRSDVITISKYKSIKEIVDESYFLYDYYTFTDKKEDEKSIIFKAWNTYLENSKTIITDNKTWKYYCSIVLFPINKRKIIGRVLTEHHDFIRMWREKSFIKDYSYWNNSNISIICSAKEWKQRSLDWKKTQSVYAQQFNGFIFNCSNIHNINPVDITEDLIDEYAPSKEERVIKVTKAIVFEQFIKEHSEEILLKDYMKIFLSVTEHPELYLSTIKKVESLIIPKEDVIKKIKIES